MSLFLQGGAPRLPPPWGQGPCLPLAHPPYLPGQPPRRRLRGLERIPNKKNSASRFSLPQCQMTRALHHPRQKSSCEGGGGHQPRSKPSLVPVSSLAHPTHTPQGPRLKGKRAFPPLPWGSPDGHRTPAPSEFSWLPGSKRPQRRLKQNSCIHWRQG